MVLGADLHVASRVDGMVGGGNSALGSRWFVVVGCAHASALGWHLFRLASEVFCRRPRACRKERGHVS